MTILDPQGQPVTPAMPKNVDPALAEAAFKFQYEKTTIWEETLRLTIAPRPRWCPVWLFQWAIKLVLRQEKHKKVNPEALTRRRAFKMFRPVNLTFRKARPGEKLEGPPL